MLDRAIQSFPLQLIFRGIFPGCFFTLAFVIAKGGNDGVTEMLRGDFGWQILGVSTFAGVVAYTILRSSLYPIIEHALVRDARDPITEDVILPLTPPFISKSTCESLLQQWTFGREYIGEDSRDQILAGHLKSWNDYVHLQYAAALCIVFGATAGRYVSLECEWGSPHGGLILTLFLLVFSAIVADIRRRTMLAWFLSKHPNAPPAPVKVT